MDWSASWCSRLVTKTHCKRQTTINTVSVCKQAVMCLAIIHLLHNMLHKHRSASCYASSATQSTFMRAAKSWSPLEKFSSIWNCDRMWQHFGIWWTPQLLVTDAIFSKQYSGVRLLVNIHITSTLYYPVVGHRMQPAALEPVSAWQHHQKKLGNESAGHMAE